MNDFESVAAFAGAALVIPTLLAFAKSVYDIPGRFLPVTCLALSAVWGALLWWNGSIHPDAPTFIVQVLVTAAAASGLREVTAAYVPGVSNLALLQPKATTVPDVTGGEPKA